MADEVFFEFEIMSNRLTKDILRKYQKEDVLEHSKQCKYREPLPVSVNQTLFKYLIVMLS